MKKAKEFFNDSDDEEQNIPQDLLERYKAEIETLADSLNIPDVSSNPEKIVEIVRKKLTEQMTKKARVKSAKDDLAKFKYDPSISSESIKSKIAERKGELEKRNNELKELQLEEQNLLTEIENLQKTQKDKAEIATILSNTDQLKAKLEELSKISDSLKEKEQNLKDSLSNNSSENLSAELQEERTKRLNVQSALDSLKAENEKRNEARQIYIQEKKELLSKQIADIEASKRDILTRRDRVEQLQENIKRYNNLISRQERHTELELDPEPTKPAPPPINKARIGRLIMLLLTEGPSNTIIKNLGEELNWSEEQTNDFLSLVKAKPDNSIGSAWANWLDRLATD
ncbi:uncharacterized protein GO595_000626 [Histomonas meleagridis]|uniref:uncharacterized protein n=1 Tax=Histomonas meleagridis TaxID=135588 RepID=UPI00355A2DEA|nr:hypothetical protein GO595_000626 [Histomonas meleagridis]